MKKITQKDIEDILMLISNEDDIALSAGRMDESNAYAHSYAIVKTLLK